MHNSYAYRVYIIDKYEHKRLQMHSHEYSHKQMHKTALQTHIHKYVRVHIQAKDTDIHHSIHQKVIGHTNLFTFTSARNV